MPTHEAPASWSQLLQDAVNVPGRLSEAYSAFHNYSVGNQLLAMHQCIGRELPVGPITTYKGWTTKGRQVKKGEKAIVLCQPIVVKGKPDEDGEPGQSHVWFSYKPKWFVLSQTEGEEVPPVEIPAWSRSRALDVLGITVVPFDMISGNSQGFALPDRGEIAINPVAVLPHKTTFHELGHCLLHKGQPSFDDGELIAHNLVEVEAESVALICTETLGLEGAEFSRGYIQHWLKDGEIPEASARRVFSAADKILKAGRPVITKDEE